MEPLKAEERLLAEQNHDLVYKFLNENNLSESQYYDVIIFGYLCAAQEYCENPKLKKYSFSTIAWKQMKQELYKHRLYLERRKRCFSTVSLSSPICDVDDSLNINDIIVSEEDLLSDLRMDLLLHSLASEISQKQMRILKMKLDGYRMHDIAKSERMTFRDINKVLADVYLRLSEIFN